MNKSTDEEAAAHGALARRLAMDLREHARTLQDEGERKCPDLEAIRSTCFAAYEGMDARLSTFDRKHGTQREKATTKIWLRTLLGRQQVHSDLLESDVKAQQALNDRSTAQLAEAVQIVANLVALCQSRGVPIPPELMGPPQ